MCVRSVRYDGSHVRGSVWQDGSDDRSYEAEGSSARGEPRRHEPATPGRHLRARRVHQTHTEKLHSRECYPERHGVFMSLL